MAKALTVGDESTLAMKARAHLTNLQESSH